MYAPTWSGSIAATARLARRPEDCEYYGNHGRNVFGGYCQNRATHAYDRDVHGKRFACDEHAGKLGFFRLCKKLNHTHATDFLGIGYAVL